MDNTHTPQGNGCNVDQQNSLALVLPSFSMQALPSLSLSKLLGDDTIQQAIEGLTSQELAGMMGDNGDGAANWENGAAPAAIPQLLRRLSANLLQGTVRTPNRGCPPA